MTMPFSGLSEDASAVLQLSFVSGLGPVLIQRLLERFDNNALAAIDASPAQLESIHGIGRAKAALIASNMKPAHARAATEASRAADLGIHLLTKSDPRYPHLLAVLPDAPPILSAKGTLFPQSHDQFPVAIVGARQCSAYGLEQSQFFASSFARSGLTVVSGGARGIDSAAHRGALAAGGRTFAVLGCGLLHAYPSENADLFEQIAHQGAVLSELPLDTPPQAENFPARNRIISGISLGTLVIEAGERSGALITAKVAAEEHGREVFALPGRVDSPASRGTLALLKCGGALIATEPADVVQGLEQTAHHIHRGSFADRFPAQPAPLFAPPMQTPDVPRLVTPAQAAILAPLAQSPLTFDQLHEATGIEVVTLRRELSLLELGRRITRLGSQFSLPAR